MTTQNASKSHDLFQRACAVLPGGVSSPVRAYRAVGGEPPVMVRAHGATITDADGRDYLDFVCSWGPLALGHSHPAVVEAIQRQVEKGTTFGAPCEGEVHLAETIQRLTGVESLRFVSSGTEATMSAIRLARGFTGRDKVVKFSGCYHGHADHLLVSAGSGLVTFGEPSSAGVPQAFTECTLVLPLDDLEALQALFQERGHEIAAVILEPIPANNGLLLQRPEFLQALRRLTAQHGSVLIFDEVISGFRVAPGGAWELFGIEPDLVCYGKIVGGGLPVGAFGGKREIMNHLAPLGPVYQAGTLSGNPLAMAAGQATLQAIEEANGWQQLEVLGAELEAGLAPMLAAKGFSLVRQGSLFWMNLQAGEPPRTAECIAASAAEHYKVLFHSLLEEGIAIAPSAYEVGFLSLAHTSEDLQRFLAAMQRALDKLPTPATANTGEGSAG